MSQTEVILQISNVRLFEIIEPRDDNIRLTVEMSQYQIRRNIEALEKLLIGEKKAVKGIRVVK